MSRNTFIVHVDLPHACFGLVVFDGKVIDAPPIARWTIGKVGQGIVRYYRRKGATIHITEARTMDKVTVEFTLERDTESGPKVTPDVLQQAVGEALDGQMVEAVNDDGVTVYNVVSWDAP